MSRQTWYESMAFSKPQKKLPNATKELRVSTLAVFCRHMEDGQFQLQLPNRLLPRKVLSTRYMLCCFFAH